WSGASQILARAIGGQRALRNLYTAKTCSFYISAGSAAGRQECQPPSRHDLSAGTSLALSCGPAVPGAELSVERRIDERPGRPRDARRVMTMGSKVIALDSDDRFRRNVNGQLAAVCDRNAKLVNALYEAREQITALKEEVDKLCAPPSTYGVYLSPNEDGTVNILSQGRKVKVNLHPSIKGETLKPGQELILNEGLNVVEAAGYEIQGDVVILKEQLDEERAIVTLRADEDKVGIIADPLRQLRLKVGDHLLMDAKSGYLLEKLPKSEVEDLSLEEVPDIGYG